MDQVTQILNSIDLRESEGRKAISVDHIHHSTVQFDLGHLMVQDQNEFSAAEFKKKGDTFVNERARDLTQLFINEIWSQKRDSEDRDVVPLPEAQMRLPRNLEYVTRPDTKWEKFSKKKGIIKKKKDSLVWDEEEKKWKPRFGYRGINQSRRVLEQKPEEE
jgi:regulator of ribosome biosynthesis